MPRRRASLMRPGRAQTWKCSAGALPLPGPAPHSSRAPQPRALLAVSLLSSPGRRALRSQPAPCGCRGGRARPEAGGTVGPSCPVGLRGANRDGPGSPAAAPVRAAPRRATQARAAPWTC